MAKRNVQDYFCKVVSEEVRIQLTNKVTIGLQFKKDYFVKCDQEDCQYVDKNAAPCPLGIEMFNLT